MYKEKEIAPKSERKSPEQGEETEVDLVVTTPTPTIETAESGEEQMPAEGEETGEETPVTKQKVEGNNDINTEVNRNDNDEETKPEEEKNSGKEQEKDTKTEKEKEEQEQKEEQVKKVIPKSEFINNKIYT